MGKTRKILFSISILASSVLCGMIAATQYVAAGLSYHPDLGGGIVRLGGMAVYQPWMFWVWTFRYGQSLPGVFDIAYFLQIFGIAAGVIGIVLFKRFAGEEKRSVKPFGEESWGTLEDAKKAKLLGNKDGVIIGKMEGELLKHDGAEHILVSGATRSGKGVGIVVPTLWNWRGSAIVYDPKEELWDLTAGYRSKSGKVAYFNPSSENSISINPLLYVRKGASEIGDIQNIVEFLSNPNATMQQRNIWEESGKSLVTAIILHVLYAEEDDRKNLAVVRDKLFDLDSTLKAMMRTPHRLNKKTGEPEVHPEVLRVAKAIYGKYKKFRESVAGTAETYLKPWAGELVAEKTSQNDFDIEDFITGDEPFTLYIQIPYEDNERLAPLLRFMIAQITRPLLRAVKKKKHTRRVLMCLEEFPAIGKVDFLERDLGMVAGYGLKALLVCQSANFIQKEYGQNTTIFDNCHVQIAFASNDPSTQKRMSQMAGQATEIRESVNYQRDKLGWKRGSTVSYSESTRTILNEGQARELDETKQLIFIGSTKPLKTDKLRYYDYEHLDRLKDISPPENDRLASGGSKHDWVGERAKGKLLPMPKIKVERESGEELQDDLVIKAEKLTLHNMIHEAKKRGLSGQDISGDLIGLDDNDEDEEAA